MLGEGGPGGGEWRLVSRGGVLQEEDTLVRVPGAGLKPSEAVVQMEAEVEIEEVTEVMIHVNTGIQLGDQYWLLEGDVTVGVVLDLYVP